MTKQEEIRDGLAMVICKSVGEEWKDGLYREYYREKADIYLNYLHSQGVVIRGEQIVYADENSVLFNRDAGHDMRIGYISRGRVGYISRGRVGYTVEPLKEDSNG